MINLQKTDNNILTLSIDGRVDGPNLITEAFLTHLETLIEEVTRDEGTHGVIITSTRDSFLAGADLSLFKGKSSAQEVYEVSRKLQKVLRKLESWGRPVVCAINGDALGGGLELALACHYRVAINHKRLKIGLPEAKLGLMPGGGGTQRLIRLIGIERALPLLLEGSTFDSNRAREFGIVDELADNLEELNQKAKAYIEQNPKSVQRWEAKKWNDPHRPDCENGYQFFGAASSLIEKNYRGRGEGPLKILSAVFEGSLLPIEQACEVEANYFAKLVTSDQAQNMLETLFYAANHCKNKGNKFTDEATPIKSIGIIGAGIMGQGIAYVSAKMGLNVYILDQDVTTAEMGINKVSQRVERDVTRGFLTEDKKKSVLQSIHSVESYQGLKSCDLVIEAALENLNLKKEIFSKLEAEVSPDTILASNTSSLPISEITQGMKNPERVLGLHFFSPVPRMPLVEIIKANATNQMSLIRALKFVKDLGKIPIIVRDGLGFFTTRVFMRYITEALLALSEGASPALIENAGKQLGFPLGPLEVGDEVSLSLMKSLIEEKARIEKLTELEDPSEKKTLEIVSRFLSKHERQGKKNGKGFYDHNKDGPKRIANVTYDEAKLSPAEKVPTFQDLKDRLFYIQLIETMKCYEEGILNTAHEGDLASIFGWGFPMETGGIVKACHKDGNEELILKLTDLQNSWGKRFTPPKILKTLINKSYSSLHEARDILPEALLEE
jgi:3-hydroxyacyl-CoA dehydrogenase/enoyl-CoA hydratase/3-hydroxybutyryl-CoA epimerase